MRFGMLILIFILTLRAGAQTSDVPPTTAPPAASEDGKTPAETSLVPPPRAGVPPPANRPLWRAHLLREKRQGSRINDLYILESQVPVVLIPRQGGFSPLVEVKGKFDKPDWQLRVGQDPVRFTANDGNFSVYAYLRGRVNEVVLTALGPKGEVQTERVFIYSPEAQEYKMVTPWDPLLVGVGASYLHYAQTNASYFKSITGLVEVKFDLHENTSRWGAFVGADATVLTVASAPINRGPSLIQGRIDAVYRLDKEVARRRRTQIVAGGNYSTVISNGSPYGFSNLMAGEIGFRTRYATGPKTAWVGEFRYVPIRNALKFEERAMDLSLTWARILPNVHRFELGLSYGNINYRPQPEIRVETGLLSFRIGYGI